MGLFGMSSTERELNVKLLRAKNDLYEANEEKDQLVERISEMTEEVKTASYMAQLGALVVESAPVVAHGDYLIAIAQDALGRYFAVEMLGLPSFNKGDEEVNREDVISRKSQYMEKLVASKLVNCCAFFTKESLVFAKRVVEVKNKIDLLSHNIRNDCEIDVTPLEPLLEHLETIFNKAMGYIKSCYYYTDSFMCLIDRWLTESVIDFIREEGNSSSLPYPVELRMEWFHTFTRKAPVYFDDYEVYDINDMEEAAK